MSIILISIFACVFTFLGGLFALKYKDKLHLIIGFSAGAILGVAFFDLIPESIDLSSDSFSVNQIITVVALGYLIYMLADRFIISHNHKTGEYCECKEEEDHHHKKHSKRKGALGAASLAFHSFLDGLSIGIAFQVSQSVGIIVAVAVLIHDFSDGLNTVNMILKNDGERKNAMKWLAVDAIAPVLGVLSTLFFSVPKNILGLILAMFAGFFIYIASSNMIPESHHSHPTKWTSVMTVLGALVLFVSIKLAGI